MSKDKEKHILEIHESQFLYLQGPFKILEVSKLSIEVGQNAGFEILLSYSFEPHQFLNFKPLEEYKNPVEYKSKSGNLDIYICIFFKKLELTDRNNLSLEEVPREIENVLQIKSIVYNKIKTSTYQFAPK